MNSASATVFVLNGPNLNLLGTREPDVYGHETLADIEAMLAARAEELGLRIEFRQTNQEGELVDWVQEAGRDGTALIINAAAYTHTSVAVGDAVAAISIPTFEVHLSNIFAREEFRHHSHISASVKGVVCGFGAMGYKMALEAIAVQRGN